MKCFYHTDLDGECSAAIVKYHMAESPKLAYQLVECVPINYNGLFPLDTIRPGEWVYIVDFSIEPDIMLKLLAITSNVTWIDHHRTAIEKYDESELDHMDAIAGIRSTEKAACALTWEFFFPDDNMPVAVQLIADRDIWTFRYGQTTKDFHNGLLALDTNPDPKPGPYATAPCVCIWHDLLSRPNPPFSTEVSRRAVDRILHDGQAIGAFREQWSESYCKAWAFEAEIDGHKALCANIGKTGSELFGEGALDDWPILSTFVYDGEKFVVSLYSSQVDVGRIAEKYGGGGHPGASGFMSQELPYQRMQEGE